MARITYADIIQAMKDDVARLKTMTTEWQRVKPKQWGYPTGMVEVDKLTGGLVPDEFIILAGAPGMGKTSLGLQITEYAAYDTKTAGKDLTHVIVSAEMPRMKLLMRSACRIAKIDSLKLRVGDVTPQELATFQDRLDWLLDLPIVVIDKRITSLDVRNLLNMLMAEGKQIGVVCVDYLQHLDDEGEDISRISRIMQNLGVAKMETGCSMLVLSQYTREKEKADRPPKLQDLFGGSRIENDADQVWALHHPDPNAKFTANPLIMTQCHVLKNRNGRLGIVDLRFHKTYTNFDIAPPTAGLRKAV